MSDGDQDEEPPVETSAGADDAPEADASTDDLAFEDDGALDDSALDQSEIDDLFGIGADGDESPNTGLQALLASRHIEHKRLPLLEACFDRLVHALTKSMRTFTSGDVELTLVDASSVRFGNYIEAIPLPAFVSVFKAIEWNEYGLISVDSPLIYAIIDVLLGGRRTAAALAVEARSFTSIEAMLIERLIVLVVKEMTSAFKPLADVEFCHERLESNPSRVRHHLAVDPLDPVRDRCSHG